MIALYRHKSVEPDSVTSTTPEYCQFIESLSQVTGGFEARRAVPSHASEWPQRDASGQCHVAGWPALPWEWRCRPRRP